MDGVGTTDSRPIARPSSTNPSQSSSAPLQVSAIAGPGVQVFPPHAPAVQVSIPTLRHAPMPQIVGRSRPSSTTPLQSSSTPLQVSTAAGCTAGSESLQSPSHVVYPSPSSSIGGSGAYLPPLLKPYPPQINICVPVHTAVWPTRPWGAFSSVVGLQVSVAGSYRPPELRPLPPQTTMVFPVQTAV